MLAFQHCQLVLLLIYQFNVVINENTTFGGIQPIYSKSPFNTRIQIPFSFSACSVGRQLPTLHEQVCTFNGSNEETLLPLFKKRPKTHPKISSTLHLCCDLHVHHTIETLSLWKRILRNQFSWRVSQCSYAPIIQIHSLVNVQFTTWFCVCFRALYTCKTARTGRISSHLLNAQRRERHLCSCLEQGFCMNRLNQQKSGVFLQVI